MRAANLEEVFIERVLAGASECELALSEAQARMCWIHVSTMLEWNRHINLTRIVEWDEIIEKHIFDSLIPAKWLPVSGMALDIGSGAGFPGLPLKIYRPSLQMTLLDVNRKKVSFLKVVAAQLGLSGLHAVQGRWEKLPILPFPPLQNALTLITSRALKLDALQIEELAGKMLGPGGVLACWSTMRANEASYTLQDEKSRDRVTFEGSFPYRLPWSSSYRFINVWKRAE